MAEVAADAYQDDPLHNNLFKWVVAAIVNNANTDGFDFEQLKKDVCGNRGLMQRIKAIFAKKK